MVSMYTMFKNENDNYYVYGNIFIIQTRRAH